MLVFDKSQFPFSIKNPGEKALIIIQLSADIVYFFKLYF